MINAILALAAVGGVLGLLLGIADKYLKVEEDPRIEVVLGKLAGVNCGKCAPTNAEKKAEIVEYLNSTPGPDGTTLKVSI